MGVDGSPQVVRSWRGGPLRTAALIAVMASGSAAAIQATTLPAAGDVVTQTGSEDPCRYVTAEAMGSAFGRPMKSSKLADICQYKDAGNNMVVVKVTAGSEGTIFRHAKAASAQGQKGAEKVTTPVGEAYFDSILSAFVARVGNHEVQMETTIEPAPRDAMVAIGTRILKMVAGR